MNKITFFSSLVLLVAVYTSVVVVYAGTTVAPNPNPIFYQKSFTVTSATTCGPSLTIPITGFNNILQGWTKYDSMLTQTAGLTIPQSARIYSIGITAKLAVPSGQWNFLTASAKVAGLTGRLIPKGGFCSSCGTTASVGASTDEIITVTIGEPIPDDMPPKTFIANGNIFTNVFADGNGAPQPIPTDASRIYPNPLNLDNVPTTSSTLWSGIPFLPTGTLDTSTVLGTVSLATDDNSYPVCWNSMSLDVRVILCPANTLANSDHPENPSALLPAPPVNSNDESYRGSFITWRQDIPSATPVPTNSDSVQVDLVTSWAKGTTATPTSLSNLRLDILSVPTSGTPVNLLSTNFLLIDQGAVPGVTTTATGFGTLWGSLASVGAATGTPTTQSFPWDRDSTAPVLSYDTYVKSLFLTIPGRVSVASSRQIRVVVSGCCRPYSLMIVDNNTPANPAPSTPTNVIPSAAVPYSIEAVMTLEHPAASAANPINPVFPRSSPEVFIPPIIFLGGSPAPGATPDSVAFGGFVTAGNAEAGTTYGFSISEVAATNTQNTLLTGATTSFLPAAGPYRSILLQAKMLDLSTFSTSGAVIPRPLAGTTVRGVLTQTNAANQLISSTTYDFLAIRRTTDTDETVDENVSCNLVTNDGLNNYWNAFTGTTLTAGTTGAATPLAITTPDAIPAAQTQINYEFAFALNKQCGNQLTVKPLRTNSQVYQTVATTTLGANNRPGNLLSPALFFLANDATDTSNPVLPVFIKTAVGGGYTPPRQALAGLEVLAVGLVGFNNRPTAVSQTYPSGTKSFSRERMGVSYCYARPYFTCPTGASPITPSVTAATCISPYTESTTCTGTVQLTITSARTPVAFGTYTYKVLLLTLDSSSTVVNAVYQTATSTAGGGNVVITFNAVKPPPTGGSLSYYSIDAYGCPLSGTLTNQIYPAVEQMFAVTLQSQVEPACVAGTPTGGSATFLITGPAAAPTLQIVAGGGINYQLAPGVTLPTAATTATAVPGTANTYTWTSPNFFAAAANMATVPVITLQVGTGGTFSVSVPFRNAIGTAVISFTIALNNNYVAGPVNLAGGVPGTGYTFQWYTGATTNFAAATAINGATSSTYQVTAANQGQYLFLVVTDSLGCTGVASYAVAGAGTAPAVTVTPTVAISPAFSDSCAKINLAFAVSGTPAIPTNTPISVSHSRCLSLVNPALPTNAANCAQWTTFARITCNYDIVTYPPISNTMNNDVLIQYYATISATPNTPPVSTTAYVKYNLGTVSYSVVQSIPPSCGSTSACSVANPNYPRVP